MVWIESLGTFMPWPVVAGSKAEFLLPMTPQEMWRKGQHCSRKCWEMCKGKPSFKPFWSAETMAARLGHMGLRTALQKERFEANFIRSPAFCQFSSMGSLDAKWLHGEFQDSLSAGKTPGRQGCSSLSKKSSRCFNADQKFLRIICLDVNDCCFSTT